MQHDNHKIRIIQIIDSLEAGGAERMAVNYANALAAEIDFSGLVATRKEGSLVNQIHSNVEYLFLGRKKTFDTKALFRLCSFVKKNKVDVIHAHSTSFFIAVLLKLLQPQVKLIWHDHYGDSDFLERRKKGILKKAIPFFSGVVVVNQKLKIWTQEKLHFKNVVYLPNFVSKNTESYKETLLKGTEGKRIVCLANLREQKNHFLLLDVAKKIKQTHPDWSFHLVGKDFEDAYSQKIKSYILEQHLEHVVYVYGSRQDVENILNQSTIAVLSSQSEGLPVALLEYGLYKKPVVVTAVGDMPMLINNGVNGFLVSGLKVNSFYLQLTQLMDNKQLQMDFALALHQTIREGYTEKKVIELYLDWLKNY